MATVSEKVHGTAAIPEIQTDGKRPAAALPQPIEALSEAPEYCDFPCSVAQERFWLLDRLEPGNPAYNVAVRWQLEGAVDTALLEQAWNEILARHEILRTRFLEIDGKPVQRVQAQAALRISEIDLESLAPEARAAEGDRIGLIEARAPFDLGTGPLIRVVLLRHSATLAVILVTTHQMVADGWSIGVMAREMGLLYEALRAHRAPPFADLAIQYGDYASWQLEWLRQRGTQAEHSYWQRQLQGVQSFEVVPDRLRPAVPTTNGAIASLVLPRELTDRMALLSAAQGVTLFATAVAALCATLARYTGKSSVVIGTQVSERDQVELEPMIGQFVNSLILRNDLSGDPPFAQIMQRAGGTITEALEHRHIPIEQLLDMVKAGRGGSSSPPISVNFIFQRTFIDNRDYGDFTLIDMPSLPAGAIYDLNFFMVERADGWRFSCQYNTDQFEPETARRLLGYFRAALESAVENPALPLSALRLADTAEVQRLAARLSGPIVAHPPTQTLAAQLSGRAELAPAAVAIQHGERRVTFAQLEAQARGVARRLQQAGIGPGARVALLLERSPELIVAMFAALKTGAAYVPLDPATPAQELARLLEVSAAQAVLAPAALGASLRTAAPVISDFSASEAGPEDAPVLAAAGTAAVWFTRRDARDPVAVEVTHQGLMNMLSGVQMRIGLYSADTVISFGAVAPESAPVQLLLPLLCGARVAIATPAEAADPQQLAHLVRRGRMPVVAAAPDFWPGLLKATPPRRRFAKVLFERGALDAALAARLLARGAELWALHGYVETSGCVAARRVREPHDLSVLGEPFANTRLRVLDERLAAPPVGATGRLFVGGDAVAAGYLSGREPERFIADPAGGTQLFNTGDWARVRADGTVEILDVELPQARAAAAAPGTAATPADAQLEGELRALWSELLGQEVSDPRANFFELGGHSLLAARMLARVEKQYGRRITLAALFRAPSVRGLARLLRSAPRDFDFRQMVRLQADGTNPPIIAINNTGVYYLLAKRLGAQQPVTSLQVFDPSVRRATLPGTLEEIAAEYVQLIRRVHPRGPYVLAGWCVAGALAFEIARQLVESGQPVAQLFLIDTWLPRYFARLPVWRRLIGSQSMRWQMTRMEWAKFTAGQQTLRDFFNRLITVRRATALLERIAGTAASAEPQQPAVAPQDYDQWLLQYLRSRTDRYEPQPYRGRITLFRSTHEPTGWWFDPLAGWGRYASEGVELVIVPGNHFTMFQDPGCAQMAERMAALIAQGAAPAAR
jgi:non-ribosomal peptide synthetase component F/thioesterase domain-containing protein